MAKQKTKTAKNKTAAKQEKKTEQKPVQEFQEQIRKQVKELDRAAQNNHLTLAEKLHEIYTNNYWKEWGFEDYPAYANAELSMGFRESYYHVQVWEAIVEQGEGLSRKDLEEIQWSKLKILVKLLKFKDIDLEEWLERAKTLTVRELDELIKAELIERRGQAPVPSLLAIKIKMQEPEARPYLDAMKYAREALETNSDALALSHICMDWLESKGADPENTDIDDIVAWIESLWDVKVTYEALGEEEPKQEKEEPQPEEPEPDPEPEKDETEPEEVEESENTEPEEPEEQATEPEAPNGKKRSIDELLDV